jgi:serine protein kinase
VSESGVNGDLTVAEQLKEIADGVRAAFDNERRLLSFEQFLEQVRDQPTRFTRNAAQYLLDAIDYFGVEEVVTGRGSIERFRAFDAPFDEGHQAVVGNEETQHRLIRVLQHFVRERRINRLVLIHGPNGSAKSSLVSCLMRALEAYSRTDEGALYRFNWVFPTQTSDGGRIGFDSAADSRAALDSFAFLDETQIDAKLPAEQNDNPIFLLPPAERQAFFDRCEFGDFVLCDTIRKGDLAHRSRAVFDALLSQHRGDLRDVLRHVQVERFYVSKRYRTAAVTVEPQLRVDAGARQLTHDRSLNALPRVLQSQTLFEVFGPLVEGNRGIIEYNDFFKRSLDLSKYLLATSEKGTVSLETGEMHLDAVLIATANESYLEAFKQSPDWASYKGRIELVRMPYLLNYLAEQRIYDAQLEHMALTKPVAPHTTFVVSLWAVMTRLRRPSAEGLESAICSIVGDLSPLDKARLYADGTLPNGLTSEQAQQLRAAVPLLMEEGASLQQYEGRFGASPREMKGVLFSAASATSETLSPLMVLSELEALISDKSVYEWLRFEVDGGYHQPDAYIGVVRTLYLDRVEREARESTGLVAAAEYQRIFERYVTHVNHSLRKEKVLDAISGDRVAPDESMMRDIEKRLQSDESAKAFRNHLISSIAAFKIDNPDEDVDLKRIFPDYFERLRVQYYSSRVEEVGRLLRHMLMLLDGDEQGELSAAECAAASSSVERFNVEHGYTSATAREALSVLLTERYGGAS